MRRLVEETQPTARLADLDPRLLAEQGVRALALDFDGVLAHHGADRPLSEVVSWLEQAAAVFGEARIVILSNRPVGPRIDWFRKEFPDIRFVAGVRKKPYPDGLEKTGELAAVPLSSILMVDDRLLTGCLAALRAGAIPWYVRKPYVSLRHNLSKELFFLAIRWLERLLVRLAA